MTTTLNNSDSIDTYASLAAYASSYTQGWIHKKDFTPFVTVSRSVRGIDEDRPRASTEVFASTEDGSLVRVGSQSLDVAKPVIYDISPSGTSTIALHNTFFGATGAKEDKIIVEVSSDAGVYRIDATSVHGAVMGDSWFGGSSWTSNERYFAYVAQVKADKPQTYYSSQTFTESGTTAASSKYNYVEDWGEKFVGVGALAVFVVDQHEQRIHKVGDVDTALWTVAQPCLIQAGSGAEARYILAYTAFYNLPRKLGLFSCFQRPYSIFFTELTAQLSSTSSEPVKLLHYKLSEGLKTARSIRCSPGSTRVVFLGHEVGFEEHAGCSEIFSAEVSALLQVLNTSSTPSTDSTRLYRKVVAEVAAPASTGGEASFGFPGVYAEALPARPFVSENELIMASQWASNTVVLSVTLRDSEPADVRAVSVGAEGTAAVLDVHDNYILCAISTPTAPPRIVLNDLQGRSFKQNTPVNQAVRLLRANAVGMAENKGPLSSVVLQDNRVLGLSWQTFSFNTGGVPFESIVIYPNNVHAKYGSRAGNVPVIMVPHGGPHSTMTTAYFHAYAFLAYQLGAAVVHVNYRGSPGYGQDSIHSLPGLCGKNDVADMMTALNHTLSLHYDAATGMVCGAEVHADLPKLCDAAKVAVVGGSHGGFLAGHLIGQYPEVFKACCMRNPVTNIPAMYSVSDIPGN